jgi:hypothetical protein
MSPAVAAGGLESGFRDLKFSTWRPTSSPMAGSRPQATRIAFLGLVAVCGVVVTDLTVLLVWPGDPVYFILSPPCSLFILVSSIIF